LFGFCHCSSSIQLSTDGDRTASSYSLWRDIVIPPNLEADIKPIWSESHFSVSDEREFLATFAGNLIDCQTCPTHRRQCCGSNAVRTFIRNKLAEHRDVAVLDSRHDAAYVRNLRSSTFCLSPTGRTNVFVRPYEAILSGCIPVVFSPTVDLAFADIIDYDRFVIYYDESKLPRLHSYLRSISFDEIIERRAAMEKVWRRFIYNTIMEDNDAVSSLIQVLATRKCRTPALLGIGHTVASPE
jgi:hypothetical protein